jgi:hypothetical protein
MRPVHLWFAFCAVPIWIITVFSFPRFLPYAWSLDWMIFVWGALMAALCITSIALFRRRRAMAIFGFVTCAAGFWLGGPPLW